MSLYVGDTILYIENPKDFTQKLLIQINKLSKVAGWKINTEKSIGFLYTNNEILERECSKSTLKIATQKLKCLETNLIKDNKDLYVENYMIELDDSNK